MFDGKPERKIFEEKGYCAVYLAGQGRSLRLGWTGKDPRKIGEPIRVIAWCAGDLLAKRVVTGVSQILASRRLVSGRYDVPVNFAEQTIRIAAEKIGIQIVAHDAMMQHIKAIRQQRADETVRKFEAESRSAALAAVTSDAPSEKDLPIFDAALNL
jgi:hypothetical protein